MLAKLRCARGMSRRSCAGDSALMHGPGGVDRLRRDGRGSALDVQVWAKVASRIVTVMPCTELTTTATWARASANPWAFTMT